MIAIKHGPGKVLRSPGLQGSSVPPGEHWLRALTWRSWQDAINVPRDINRMPNKASTEIHARIADKKARFFLRSTNSTEFSTGSYISQRKTKMTARRAKLRTVTSINNNTYPHSYRKGAVVGRLQEEDHNCKSLRNRRREPRGDKLWIRGVDKEQRILKPKKQEVQLSTQT